MKSKPLLLSLLMMFTAFIGLTSCERPKNIKPKCLAVGSARTVMIEENVDQPGRYMVTVKGSNPQTVLLTHRPQRSSKTVDTSAFLKTWNEGYKRSSPNVTFTSVSSNNTTTNVLVLSNPHYNEENGTITFDADAIEPADQSVQTGVFSNVTITYDSQIQHLLYDPVK